MRQSTRLVANLLVTFSRMALTVGVGLASTRLLLQALGDVDFGLLSTLGATGALLATVTGALTQSTQRHLAYEIGRGDRQRLSRMFSSAQALFVVVGAGLWVVGFAATPAVMHGLTIPEGRMDAAWWVYQFTLLGLAQVVVFTPFKGIIAAHQELVISSIYDLANSVSRLGIVIGIFFVPWDRLAAFAALSLATTVALTGMLIAFCLKRYPESRPRRRDVGRSEMKELTGYASWSFLATMSWTLRQQGAVILLNVAFGPAVNAAYAVARQLGGYLSQLQMGVTRVVRPAIVSLEAKGTRRHVHQLALVTSKYIGVLLTLLFVPLWLEMPQLLDLWLVQVPEHTLILVRLTLVGMLMLAVFAGHILALQATGEIGWWTRIVLGLTIVSLGLAVVAVYPLGLDPWAVPATMILLIGMQGVLAVLLIGRRIELDPRHWLRRTLLPVAMVTVPATAAAVAAWYGLPEAPWRIFTVLAAYNVVAIPLFWVAGLERWERDQFKRIGGQMLRQIGKRLGLGRDRSRE